MKNRLERKVIIVTGGNGLLGKTILKYLRSEGAICINFDINHSTNKNLSEVYCDITNKDSVLSALSIVYKKFKTVDGLVNNAYPRTLDWNNKFEDIELDSWRQNLDWQLNSYFFVSQQVSFLMAKEEKGSIVNMASIYGISAPDFTLYEETAMTMPAAYSAIKGGLVNLTRYMAAYFGPKQIRVNAVSPGGIFDHQNEVFIRNYIKKVPMKRMGTPRDVAPAVLFLLSDESIYITGQNIVIDGGYTI